MAVIVGVLKWGLETGGRGNKGSCGYEIQNATVANTKEAYE